MVRLGYTWHQADVAQVTAKKIAMRARAADRMARMMILPCILRRVDSGDRVIRNRKAAQGYPTGFARPIPSNQLRPGNRRPAFRSEDYDRAKGPRYPYAGHAEACVASRCPTGSDPVQPSRWPTPRPDRLGLRADLRSHGMVPRACHTRRAARAVQTTQNRPS